MRACEKILTKNATTKTRKHEKYIGFLRVFVLSWLPSQELLCGLRGLCVERDLFTISSGLMKILVDAESEETLGASVLGTCGDEVIQGRPRHDVRNSALFRPAARCAHSPHRVGAHPDDPRRTGGD